VSGEQTPHTSEGWAAGFLRVAKGILLVSFSSFFGVLTLRLALITLHGG